MIPALGLRLVALALFPRQRCRERREVRPWRTQQLTGHGQCNEAGEGALATARTTEEHQLGLGVEHLESGQPSGCPVGRPSNVGDCATNRVVTLGPLREQGGIDRRQRNLRIGAVAGEQRQLVRLDEDARQVCAAQVRSARPRLGTLLDDEPGVDVAIVVACDAHAGRADRERVLPLGNGPTAREVRVDNGGSRIERVPVDQSRVERTLELF